MKMDNNKFQYLISLLDDAKSDLEYIQELVERSFPSSAESAELQEICDEILSLKVGLRDRQNAQ